MKPTDTTSLITLANSDGNDEETPKNSVRVPPPITPRRPGNLLFPNNQNLHSSSKTLQNSFHSSNSNNTTPVHSASTTQNSAYFNDIPTSVPTFSSHQRQNSSQYHQSSHPSTPIYGARPNSVIPHQRQFSLNIASHEEIYTKKQASVGSLQVHRNFVFDDQNIEDNSEYDLSNHEEGEVGSDEIEEEEISSLIGNVVRVSGRKRETSGSTCSSVKSLRKVYQHVTQQYATTNSQILSSSSSVVSSSQIASPITSYYNINSSENQNIEPCVSVIKEEAIIVEEQQSTSSEPDVPKLPFSTVKNYRRLPCIPCIHLAPLSTNDSTRALLTFLYAVVSTFVCTVTLQFTHERMTERAQTEPLKDISFDLLPSRIPWAFDITEYVGLVYGLMFMAMCSIHKDRLVILRRFFFVIGTLYMYRSVLMFATNLPVPGTHLKCAPKVDGNYGEVFKRAYDLWRTFGTSLAGNHMYCGDYMYSGHTLMIITFYLFLRMYIPTTNRYIKAFKFLLCIITYSALFCILLGHDHYTIDILVAYFVATRLILMYHSAVNVGLQYPEANNHDKSKFHRRFKLRNGFCCFSAEDSSETESVVHVENGNYGTESEVDQVSKPNFTPNYHIFNWIWWWPVFLWLEKHSTSPVMNFEVQPLLLFSKKPVQTSFSQRKTKSGYGGIKNHQA